MGNKEAKFIGKVSSFGDGRKHVEVPKDKLAKFSPGDHVKVSKIDP